MRILFLTLLLTCASCTAVKDWAKDAARETAAEVYAEAERVADKDGDGEVTPSEWAEWIQTGGLGTAILLAYTLLKRRLRDKVGSLWSEVEPLREDKVARDAQKSRVP